MKTCRDIIELMEENLSLECACYNYYDIVFGITGKNVYNSFMISAEMILRGEY